MILLASVPAYAQESQQTVVIRGQTDVESSEDFVAGKLVIGKKTLDASGLQNVADVLRREPAVTVGKDGRIGLLGLPGYTQVLVDGQAGIGTDPYSMDLAQVEKIEIIKSATAATGPYGIAGTINIIRRKAERKALTQLRLNGSTVAGHAGGRVTLMSNQLPTGTPLMYNLVLIAGSASTPAAERYRQTQSLDGGPAVAQLDGQRSSRNSNQNLVLSSDVIWSLNPEHKLTLSPDVGSFKFTDNSREHRRWTDGNTLLVTRRDRSTMTSTGLPLRWDWSVSPETRWSLNAKLSRVRVPTEGQRLDSGSVDGEHVRLQDVGVRSRHRFLDLDFKTEFTGGHEFSAGMKLAQSDTDTAYKDLVDGQADLSLAVFGTSNSTRVDKRQFFIQDDWRLNRSLAVNLGLATEERKHVLLEADARNNPRFSTWSPSGHIAYKIGGNSKRQLRASIARTFKAPEANQMLLHPLINPLAPCSQRSLCDANTLDTADSAGNPDLRPERSLGVNLSYTHGLGASSEARIELYTRDITQKIGSELSLENVAWASAPRYVFRPANLGDARLRGLNLEGRLASRDLRKDAPELDVQGSVGYAHSELFDLPGPDNRLDGQLPWRAKLAGGYAPGGWPLKLSLDANWLPGDWIRNNLTQRTYQSPRFTLNAGANWKIDASRRLIFSADNLLAKDSDSIREYDGVNQTLRRYGSNAAYTRFALRLELTL